MNHNLTLAILPQAYAICRLEPRSEVPAWARGESFFSITRTAHELSVVCEDQSVPAGVHAERNRRLLRIEGTLAFSLTGILAFIAEPLAAAGISIFAVSTYDSDYLLVAAEDLHRTTAVLEAAGHTIFTDTNISRSSAE